MIFLGATLNEAFFITNELITTFTAILTSAFWIIAWGKVRDKQTSPALAINIIISSIELFFAIMAVNMSALKPLWARIVDEVTTPSDTSYRLGQVSHTREKGMPRSKLNLLGSGMGTPLASPLTGSMRMSVGGLGSESEEDLADADARTQNRANDARAAEEGRVWNDGFEIIVPVQIKTDTCGTERKVLP